MATQTVTQTLFTAVAAPTAAASSAAAAPSDVAPADAAPVNAAPVNAAPADVTPAASPAAHDGVGTGSRTAALWVPDWPVAAALQAANLSPHLPAVVMSHHGVLAASASARAAGVRRGMRKRTAQAQCPALVLLPADAERDAAQFEPVATAAEQVVAGLEVVRPGLALLPAAGAARYYGSEQRLAAELTEAVSLAGFECQVGIADGILAAVLAARAFDIVPAGASRAYLATKPVSDLESVRPVDAQPLLEAINLWQRLGLRTMGDLVALPADAMAARFAELGVWAQRLAGGADLRPPAWRRVAEEIRVEAELDPPAYQLEAAARVGERLAQTFSEVMAERSLACGRVRITADTENGTRSRVWRTDDGAVGGMSAAKIAQRVRWQLDGWLTERAVDVGRAAGEFARRRSSSGAGGSPSDGGSELVDTGAVDELVGIDEFPGGPSSGLGEGVGPAPIRRLEIAAEEVTQASAYQTGLWGSESGNDLRARRALNHVQGLLGADQVQAVVLQGGRTPAERELRFTFDEQRPAGRLLAEPWPGALPDPAPSVCLPEPVPVQIIGASGVVQVDARTLRFSSLPETLVLNDRPVPISGWAGPWLVPGNWWEGAPEAVMFAQVIAGGQALLLNCGPGGFAAVARYD